MLHDLIILFHCGNTKVAEAIHARYPAIFQPSANIPFFVSCHSTSVADSLKHGMFKDHSSVIYTIIENRGCDIGGFMHNLNALRKSSLTSKAFIVLQTKTDATWRNFLLDGIFKDLQTNLAYFDQLNNTRPCIIGATHYRYPLYKFINQAYIEPASALHNIKFDTEYIDFPTLDLRSQFRLDPIFYGQYERDLRSFETNQVISHWENYGTKEFHRINNPCVLERPHKKLGFFIAGTMFACNKSYIDLWKPINLLKEFELLEEGYIQNIVPRRTHFWEYAHGLLCYTHGGVVVGSNGIDINDKHDDVFAVMPRRAHIVTARPSKFMVAVFCLTVLDTLCGGFRTILSYINALLDSSSEITVDLYHDNQNNLDDHIMIAALDAYNEISSKNRRRLNVISGFVCQRTLIYDLMIATAWQSSLYAAENLKFAKRHIYLIQDEENKFYPDNIELQKLAESTYKIPSFEKYCLSSYLYNTMQRYTPRHVTTMCRGLIGYDDAIYSRGSPYNMRSNTVCVAYFEKVTRLPKQMMEVIVCLASEGIQCKVFPCRLPETTTLSADARRNIVYEGRMAPEDLNKLYNTCKVGIVFSSTNHSRLSVEMLASGMEVIELDNEFTRFDLPGDIYNKIDIENNQIDAQALCSLVHKLFDYKEHHAASARNKFLLERTIKNEHTAFVNFAKRNMGQKLI